MKKIFTLTVSIALLCFISVSFAGRIGLTLELTDGQVDAPHIQQRHQAIMPPPQAPVQDEPQNDGRNFYLQIGATLTKAVIHQGCYVLGMLTDELTTQRGSLLCIGVMASLANAIYNFDESDSLFRQDVLSACTGVLAGGLIGGLVGVSLNLPTEEQNEVATYVALAGGMVASGIIFVEQITQMFKRRFIFF